MAETTALSPTKIVPPGFYGIAATPPGIVATMRADAALAMIATRRDYGDGFRQAASAAFGLALPTGPKAVFSGSRAILGLAPGRWLIAAFDETAAVLLDDLTARFQDHAAIVDQSDAFVVLDLAGPRVVDFLALGPIIDLDPKVFVVGDCVSSLIAHAPVTLWRFDESLAFRLLIPRSYAPAVTRFLAAGGAKYGFEMR